MSMAGKRIGVALSGGGYRAAAYHIGTLRALHRLGILEKVDVISSVSGGSITAAYYALNKDNYEEFEKGFMKCLSKGVLRTSYLCLAGLILFVLLLAGLLGHCTALIMSTYLPDKLILSGVCGTLVTVISLFALLMMCAKNSFTALPTSDLIIRAYNKLFFKGKTLGELPPTPTLAINSTNIATQLPFWFSKSSMGEFAYRVKGKSIFTAEDFPVAKAVMASSCVPYGFTPITIEEKYLLDTYENCPNQPEPPKLIDGGVYDNQGAHKLIQNDSKFHTDFIVVSDAGCSNIRASKTNNIFDLVLNTIFMMMLRIKNMQRAENLYETYVGKEHFAYVPLDWECSFRLIEGFVQNLKKDNIHPDVWEAHGITQEEVDLLKTSRKQQPKAEIIEKIKASLSWNELISRAPQEESEQAARKIGVNLTALSAQSLNSLIAHSNWLTEAQIRLYMPMLVIQATEESTQ